MCSYIQMHEGLGQGKEDIILIKAYGMSQCNKSAELIPITSPLHVNFRIQTQNLAKVSLESSVCLKSL